MNGTIKCEKLRIISLMSHVTKLVFRIVNNGIRGRTLHEIVPEQYVFMPDKGTGNAIFVLRMLVERYIEKQKYVYVCFIEYSKAFDTVKHKLLVDLLQSLDVDQAELRLLSVVVRCGDDIIRGRASNKAYDKGVWLLPMYSPYIQKGL